MRERESARERRERERILQARVHGTLQNLTRSWTVVCSLFLDS